jgi:tRNA U34 5-carboxymethylaminomethyl modifying GTPase MnmE/TrmE
MIAEEYPKLLAEIIDIDTEISSIADSRRLLVEINEREAVLIKLKEGIVRDIRTSESDYIKRKAFLRKKYDMNQKNGITNVIRGSSKSKLIKELKKLESKSNKNIDDLKELNTL